MAETHILQAVPRQRTGSGAARTTRREDLVPAIVYGGTQAPRSIAISARALKHELERGGFLTRVYNLQCEDETVRALPREVQHDPVNGVPRHVDFLRVTDRTKLRVFVPVRFQNEETCPGLRAGGVLNIVRHEVELYCRAGSIPAEINVDLAAFHLGDSIHARSAEWPGDTRAVIERDFTIATIAAPSALRSEAEEAAEIEAEGEKAEAEEQESKGDEETRDDEGA